MMTPLSRAMLVAVLALVASGVRVDACSHRGADEAGAAGSPAIYVAPQGDDGRDGLRPEPEAESDSGPLRTIEAARDAARTCGYKRIVLRGGAYHLGAAIRFDAEDAGLTIEAMRGEQPILYGGPQLGAWSKDGSGRHSAKLELGPELDVGDIFIDDQPQVRARFPNLPPDGGPRDGWLFAAPPEPDTEWLGNARFRFHRSDLPAMDEIDGLVAHIVGGFDPWSQWGSDTLPVQSIDQDTNTIHTAGTGYFFTGPGSRYFLTGLQDFLDVPGEWWFDREASRVYLIPPDPGLRGSTVTAGILPTIFQLDDADGMTISGLTFRNTAPQGTGKYGTDTRGFGVIRLVGSDRVTVKASRFENVGVAIHVAESREVSIIGNSIAGVAGNAIYIGTEYGSFGRSDGARVLGNRIRDIGRVYFESAGIWFQAASNLLIAHNLIENAAQFGITGGSIWGEEDACYNNVIEYNIVRNTNQQTADGGGIKMMGVQADHQQSIIRHNVVAGTGHLMNRADGTFWPERYENTDEWPSPISWAIYLDGRASGITITGNLLRDNVAGIGINGGWSNIVDRNVVVRGTGSAIRVDDATGRGWAPDWHEPSQVTNNVFVIAPSAGRVVDMYAPEHGSSFVRFLGNLYWGPMTDRSFRIVPDAMPSGAVGNLGDFQAAGQDMDAEVADPGLVTEGGALTLRPGARAAERGIDLGFLRKAGPNGRDDCVRAR